MAFLRARVPYTVAIFLIKVSSGEMSPFAKWLFFTLNGGGTNLATGRRWKVLTNPERL
jgi:hypothetical protein